jgi:hypothetical protein
MKCLKKAPQERFETGGALARALSQTLEEERPLPQKASRKNTLVLFVAILLVVLGLGGISYYFVLSRMTKPDVVEEVIMGSFKVESQPIGAQVFIDGTFKGKTPLTIKLPIGKHEVRLTHPDHHDWEAQVELKEEGETPLQVRLGSIHDK